MTSFGQLITLLEIRNSPIRTLLYCLEEASQAQQHGDEKVTAKSQAPSRMIRGVLKDRPGHLGLRGSYMKASAFFLGDVGVTV